MPNKRKRRRRRRSPRLDAFGREIAEERERSMSPVNDDDIRNYKRHSDQDSSSKDDEEERWLELGKQRDAVGEASEWVWGTGDILTPEEKAKKKKREDKLREAAFKARDLGDTASGKDALKNFRKHKRRARSSSKERASKRSRRRGDDSSYVDGEGRTRDRKTGKVKLMTKKDEKARKRELTRALIESIPGYEQMSQAEKIKARMRAQLGHVVTTDKVVAATKEEKARSGGDMLFGYDLLRKTHDKKGLGFGSTRSAEDAPDVDPQSWGRFKTTDTDMYMQERKGMYKATGEDAIIVKNTTFQNAGVILPSGGTVPDAATLGYELTDAHAAAMFSAPTVVRPSPPRPGGEVNDSRGSSSDSQDSERRELLDALRAQGATVVMDDISVVGRADVDVDTHREDHAMPGEYSRRRAARTDEDDSSSDSKVGAPQNSPHRGDLLASASVFAAPASAPVAPQAERGDAPPKKAGSWRDRVKKKQK